MVGAFLFITTEVGKLRGVYETVKASEHVKKANIVTGPYDILATFESEDISELRDIVVDSIREIKGVKDTTTAIIVEI